MGVVPAEERRGEERDALANPNHKVKYTLVAGKVPLFDRNHGEGSKTALKVRRNGALLPLIRDFC